MKKIEYKALAFAMVIITMLSSCSFGGSSKKELQAENESLRATKVALEDEVNNYFATLSDVQTSIAKIKEVQHVITVDPLSENTSQDLREKVTNDIEFINELIVKKQLELDSLSTRMRKSNLKLTEMEKAIANLTAQLKEESEKVANLEAMILDRDRRIAEMGGRIASLGKNVDSLTIADAQKREELKNQDLRLNSVWYAIGTKKELKENNIITSGGLFRANKILQSDFNKDYFVKLDVRDTKSIPLLVKTKVKVLTNHPLSSYKIELVDGLYQLNIIDHGSFWSVSKYLVIQTN